MQKNHRRAACATSPEPGVRAPVVIVNDTSGENHTGCNAVMDALVALCEAHGLDVIERLTRRQILDGQAPQRCALVIINGEGSLHHNTSQARFFPRLLSQLDAMKQPAVLINSVWDAPEFMESNVVDLGRTDLFWELMQRWIRLVSVRESLSYEQLRKEWRPETAAPLLITPDLSFWLTTDPDYPFRPHKPAWVGYSDSLPVADVEKFRCNWECHSLPLRPARPADRFVHQLRHCREYHTSRFHGACFALMAGVPKIVTYPANTHKIEGLMADVEARGRGEYLIDAPARISAMMKQVAEIARQEGGL